MRRLLGLIVGAAALTVVGVSTVEVLASTSPIDAITVNGNPNSFLLRGGSVDMTPDNSTFVSPNYAYTNDGQHIWSITMSPPTGTQFAVGTYQVARDPDATHAGLNITGDGRACNTTSGTLTILQVQSDPAAFAASYHLTCQSDSGGISGEFRDNSTVDYVAAGVPAKLDLGQPVGDPATPQTITISSDGTSPLSLGAATLGGSAPNQFQLTNDGCAGQVLQPGQTCTITITPHPTDFNIFQAVVQIPDNTVAGMHFVQLQESSQRPLLTISSPYFGAVEVGKTSTAQDIYVQDDDNSSPIVFGTASITGSGAAAFSITADTCSGTTLNYLGNCDLMVTAHPTALGPQTATLVLPDSTAAGAHSATLTVTGSIGAAGTYYPLSPFRILDTRGGAGAPVQPLGAGSVLHLRVAGQGGVADSGASAVVLNVTVTSPTASSYLAVYPSGAPRPTVSNLNFPKGWTGANNVTVPLGTNGSVDIYNLAGSTQVIADVLGFYAADDSVEAEYGMSGPFGLGGQYQPVVPERILDTREVGFGGPLPPANYVVVPVDYGDDVNPHIRALAVNVTATGPTRGGYLTTWNGDSNALPTASTLNFTPKTTVPNLAIVPTRPCDIDPRCTGLPAIAVYNGSSGDVHVIVDIVGFYDDGTLGDGLTFHPITPTRIVDTRSGLGAPAAIGPKATATVTTPATVAGSSTVALAANVTAVSPTASTYLSVWPADAGLSQPTVSTVNATAGQTVPNAALITIGPSAGFNVFNKAGNTNVLVDVAGVFNFEPIGTPTASLSAAHRREAGTRFVSYLFLLRPQPLGR